MRWVEEPDPHDAVAVLAVGDTVRVVTNDGRKLQFQVAAIDADTLVGNNAERVPIDDIHMVSVRRFDETKSGLALYSTILLGIAIGALAVIAGA